MLEKGLVQSTNMELYIWSAIGSELAKITDLGSANWALFFNTSGKKVNFSSNHIAKEVLIYLYKR